MASGTIERPSAVIGTEIVADSGHNALSFYRLNGWGKCFIFWCFTNVAGIFAISGRGHTDAPLVLNVTNTQSSFTPVASENDGTISVTGLNANAHYVVIAGPGVTDLKFYNS